MMKRLVLAIVTAFFAIVPSLAGGNTISHLGVIGGLSTDNLNVKDLDNTPLAGWHVGATWELKLPLYFAIQPSVLYEQGNTKVESVKATMKDIIVPIAIQWGPDLGIIRPYVQAVPYADFVLGVNLEDVGDAKEYFKNTQFGCGLGAGLEIWKLQISARYNWAFGSWQTMTESNPFKDLGGKKQSFTLSLAFFFN